MTATTHPDHILKTVFGYDQYRPLQREVITNVLQRRDSLVIMPTGGGKSLCYQIPGLIFPGLTVVVSPLIALMKDQVEQLRELGVPACFLNSSLSQEEYRENMEQVRTKKVKLLYVAPETLLTPRLFNLLESVSLDCLTIDEAHCISEWGHDFRPEYRQLVDVRARFPKAVCLALTATATPRVRADIKSSLGFQDSNEFVASFNRPNLMIEVQSKSDPLSQTLSLLERFPGQSGIIYCFSRKQVDELTAVLAQRGFSVRSYHAGLEDNERKQSQELFIRDDVQIIVATIAFGMGINKPNVRFVVHYDLPKSIEGYYQEIGRAGRDGLPAHCLLLYHYGDAKKLQYFIEQKVGSEREAAYQHLNALTRYAENDGCRRTPLLAYFGETFAAENCEMCDNCLAGEREQADVTIPVQKFLSCVKRTGERFGATHIVDVLLGSENQKVVKYGHQSLSTFGIGAELSRKQWLHLARQLVQKSLLEQDETYGSLRLAPKAYEVLKNREPVYSVVLAEAPSKLKRKQAGEIEHDAVLFELLRQKRKELAQAGGVPPYIIFSDRSLVEMAAYYPMSPASMLQVNGVGQVKFTHYGQIFMDVIRTYCEQHNLDEKPRGTTPMQPTGQMELKPRYQVVGEAYNEGASVAELMERYQVQQATIVEHLTRYGMDGSPLRDGDEFLKLIQLPPAQIDLALSAYAKLGADRLRPVFDRMEGTVSFEDLKLIRLCFLSRASG